MPLESCQIAQRSRVDDLAAESTQRATAEAGVGDRELGSEERPRPRSSRSVGAERRDSKRATGVLWTAGLNYFLFGGSDRA